MDDCISAGRLKELGTPFLLPTKHPLRPASHSMCSVCEQTLIPTLLWSWWLFIRHSLCDARVPLHCCLWVMLCYLHNVLSVMLGNGSGEWAHGVWPSCQDGVQRPHIAVLPAYAEGLKVLHFSA